QLALPVARPQFDRPVGFRGGPIGKIGMVLVLVLQVLQRFPGLAQDVLAPCQESLAEVLPLAVVHEWLFVGRPVILFFLPGHAPQTPCKSWRDASSRGALI